MRSEPGACPHCAHENAPDALRCASCDADLVAAEPGGPVPLEHRSLLLYALLFLPGVALTIFGLTSGPAWLAIVGCVLLAAPLVVQLFGAHWSDPHVDA